MSGKEIEITYNISTYSEDISQAETDDVIQRAFDMWSGHTDLKVTRKYEGPVDIDIRFAKRDHGDGFPFDGPGTVLAHALKNYVHFDDDETWTVRSDQKGVSLFKVAVREIGHSLGLSHSNEGGSMFA